jgi:16S rRNA processing protein RimM
VGGAVAIGLIRRPHGLNGEVVVTDITEGAFGPGPGLAVVLLGPNCQTATVVESWRPKGDGLLAKFAGIDGRAAAEECRGWAIAVPPEALPEKADDVYYEFELVGLPVETTAGEAAGKVVEVYSAGPHDVLVIEGGEGTREVPFVRAHVVDVRRGDKIVIVPYREE